MKVILYMAMTVNGLIAKKNNKTEWSDEEWKSYRDMVRKTGNLTTGRITYPLYEKSNFSDMNNPLVVVLTSDISKADSEKVKYANSAKKAIEILEKYGFKTTLVAGGGKTNTSFLQEKLIDEIYLDVEPMIYGEGIPLFSPSDTELKLELLETRKISKNTIQLHYKVIK